MRKGYCCFHGYAKVTCQFHEDGGIETRGQALALYGDSDIQPDVGPRALRARYVAPSQQLVVQGVLRGTAKNNPGLISHALGQVRISRQLPTSSQTQVKVNQPKRRNKKWCRAMNATTGKEGTISSMHLVAIARALDGNGRAE